MGWLMMPPVVRDNIFGMRQIVNMAVGIVDSAASVAIKSMAVHFHADESGRMKKGMQGCRVGEIGASEIADLLSCRNNPIQGLFGAVQQIQVGIVQESGLGRQGVFELSVIGGGQLAHPLFLSRGEWSQSSR